MTLRSAEEILLDHGMCDCYVCASPVKTAQQEAHDAGFKAGVEAALIAVEDEQDGCLPEGFAALEANAATLRRIRALTPPKDGG